MRIDLYGSAATDSAVGGTGAANAATAQSSSVVAEDRATLSEGSAVVPTLAQQALQTAETRLAKVDALQRAVSSGAYTLDPSLIAEALVKEGL